MAIGREQTLTQPDLEDYDPGWAPKQRSSWRWPIMGFALTAIMAAAILLYYFGPRPAEVLGTAMRPTVATDPVAVKIGTVSLVIPANHIIRPQARAGGAMEEIELAALWPGLTGYTSGDDAAFDDVSADSRIVRIVIRSRASALNERDRFERFLRDDAIARKDGPGPGGLARYGFHPASGAGGANEELFVHDEGATFAMYRCTASEEDGGAAICSRSMPLAAGVRATYRFSAMWLSEWKSLDEDVDRLLRSFELVRP